MCLLEVARGGCERDDGVLQRGRGPAACTLATLHKIGYVGATYSYLYLYLSGLLRNNCVVLRLTILWPILEYFAMGSWSIFIYDEICCSSCMHNAMI